MLQMRNADSPLQNHERVEKGLFIKVNDEQINDDEVRRLMIVTICWPVLEGN